MKRNFFVWLLLMSTAQVIHAQTTTATGSVKDEKGNPLHFVFVGDDQYNNATYSDSLGNFTVTVHPDSKLQFELAGCKGALISIDKNNMAALQVVLKSTGNALNNAISTKVAPTQDGVVVQRPDDVDLLRLPGHEKGNEHGNRYLFNNFAHGFVINSSGELVHNPDYMMDYDKTTGAVVLTEDGKTINQLSWDRTKSFTLFTNKDETLVFEKVPAISDAFYVQVLASGKKYKLCKLIKTKFVKADYVNSGVVAHGNDYDEYIDEAEYYVTDAQGNQPQKLALKKKAIKEGFAKDADKVNKFLSDNSGSISDTYLSKLGAYMNQ